MVREPEVRRSRNWPSVVGNPEQRASRAMFRLEDITRLVSEWVWEMDADCRLTFVSERATEVLGLLPFQLVGRKFSDLGTFASRDDGSTEPDWRSPFRDVPFDMRGGDGETRHFLVSGLPFYDPETWQLEGFCGVAEDISTWLQREDELRVAKEAAEAASRAKSDFLSYMGHELRTPLTAIIGFSEILERRIGRGEIGEEVASCIQYVNDSGLHLLNLVEEVLEFSSTEKQSFEPENESIDFRSILDACLAIVSGDAAKQGVSIVDETENQAFPEFVGDAHMLQRILLNLLSNAVIYNREEGRVRVFCTTPRPGILAVHVEDTGPGIEPDQLEAAFEPFNRLGREAGAIGGTGLGLALVKRMVEAMGGEVKVESRVGHGSRFWIELPTTGGDKA